MTVCITRWEREGSNQWIWGYKYLTKHGLFFPLHKLWIWFNFSIWILKLEMYFYALKNCFLFFFLDSVLVYGSHSVLINLSKEYGRIVYSSASVVFMIELTKVRKADDKNKQTHSISIPNCNSEVKFSIYAGIIILLLSFCCCGRGMILVIFLRIVTYCCWKCFWDDHAALLEIRITWSHYLLIVLLWTGECGTIRNATHNICTHLKKLFQQQ